MSITGSCGSTSSTSNARSETVPGVQPVNTLHSAFDVTRTKFVSSIKFSLMKKLYRPIYDKNPKALRTIYEQLCSQLLQTINDDFDETCKELSIDFLLNSLQLIKKNQESINPSQLSWRPSGNPEEDLRDHLHPLKVKHKESLQSLLNNLKASNEQLVEDAAVNHAEILHLKKSVQDLHARFSNIMTSLSGPNLQNLRKSLDDTMLELIL